MLSVLHICQSIEQQIGRNKQSLTQKQQKKWAPREIDIDILLLDNLQINYQNILQIPHYQLQNRHLRWW
jgi:2-amino-4-hydroxy-6-hydroxymethyldihydropteridine diphosphokinase